MNIGIIGGGNVGGALGKGWARKRHLVRFGVPNPTGEKAQALIQEIGGAASIGTVAEAAAFGDVVVLAIPWKAAQEAIQNAGDLDGKILLDCMNPIKSDFSHLEVGHTTSGAEILAGWATRARVVKIFNTVGFNIMENPDFGGQAAYMPYCGDDADAKAVAAQLAAEIGFDAADVGPLSQAWLLEAAAWLWITMAVKYGHGREIAFALLKR